MGAAIRVTVIDGPAVTLRYDELSARDVADFNAELGRGAFGAFVRDPSTHDLDVAAALLWLGWRRDAPSLTFEQVASQLTFESAVLMELVPDLDEERSRG